MKDSLKFTSYTFTKADYFQGQKFRIVSNCEKFRSEIQTHFQVRRIVDWAEKHEAYAALVYLPRLQLCGILESNGCYYRYTVLRESEYSSMFLNTMVKLKYKTIFLL